MNASGVYVNECEQAPPDRRHDFAPPRAALGAAEDVVSLPVALLVLDGSPRLEGHDEAHVSRLAEVDGQLPPILVERGSLRVIDGVHRTLAALRSGRPTIEARYFDGPRSEVFLHAVQANVRHGHPLSLADRRAAAGRILGSHPHLSDRAIAEIAGLGAKTVAAIRREAPGASAPGARIGRDGRVRPVDGAEGRRRVVELMNRHPHSSLRAIARWAGVSPATVTDVRKRLDKGESPEPRRPEPDERREQAAAPAIPAQPSRAARVQTAVDPLAVLEKLLRDPSLRYKDAGRELLALLRQNALSADGWDELATVVPPHSGALVEQLAHEYARQWSEFARQVEMHEAPSARDRTASPDE